MSAPPSRPAALPARRLPEGKTEATPALRAFLDRAAGKQASPGTLPPAKPGGVKLPPPRPIEPRRTEAAASPGSETLSRFRLPPPAPVTAAPALAFAPGLPPPPPATGSPGNGVLPPPAETKAGGSEALRRPLALDAARRAAGAAPAEVYSETFFHEAGGLPLGADQRERVRRLAARVNGAEGLSVVIRAYSGAGEGNGADARRRALSRAMEVRGLLIAAGVPDTRITARAAGAGEEPAGRVDIVLVKRS